MGIGNEAGSIKAQMEMYFGIAAGRFAFIYRVRLLSRLESPPHIVFTYCASLRHAQSVLPNNPTGIRPRPYSHFDWRIARTPAHPIAGKGSTRKQCRRLVVLD
jgi:hypothetical protein